MTHVKHVSGSTFLFPSKPHVVFTVWRKCSRVGTTQSTCSPGACILRKQSLEPDMTYDSLSFLKEKSTSSRCLKTADCFLTQNAYFDTFWSYKSPSETITDMRNQVVRFLQPLRETISFFSFHCIILTWHINLWGGWRHLPFKYQHQFKYFWNNYFTEQLYTTASHQLFSLSS